MKILLINYRYFFSGGPEKYMFGIKALLESHGHEVIPFSVKSSKNNMTFYEEFFVEPVGGDNIYYEEYKMTPKTILQMIDRQFYSIHVKKKLEKLISETKPDIAYLMHHYNKLSPSVIDACKKNKIPVVMRLSDFFLACPNALFIRDNKVCEECKKTLLHAIRHRCVKGSLPSSVIKVMAMYFHRLIKIYDKVDYIIAPSEFTIKKLKNNFKNIFVQVPTFIKKTENYNATIGDYALFVGRIEEEKGVLDAIKAAGKDIKLKIAGKSSTGYDEKIMKEIGPNVEYLGPKYGEELNELYRNARAVIIPARWYENMPNVALEAMMHSRPLILSDIGSLGELVKDGYNGFLFKPGDSNELRKKIKMLFNNDILCNELGANAYKEVTTRYTPEKHYEKLMHVFEKALEEV